MTTTLDDAIILRQWHIVPSLISMRAKITDPRMVALAISQRDEGLILSFIDKYPRYAAFTHYGVAGRGDIALFNKVYEATKDRTSSYAIEGFVDGGHAHILSMIVNNIPEERRKRSVLDHMIQRAIYNDNVGVLSSLLKAHHHLYSSYTSMVVYGIDNRSIRCVGHILSTYSSDMVNYDTVIESMSIATSTTSDDMMVVDIVVKSILSHNPMMYLDIAEAAARCGNTAVIRVIGRDNDLDYDTLRDIMSLNGHDPSTLRNRDIDWDMVGTIHEDVAIPLL